MPSSITGFWQQQSNNSESTKSYYFKWTNWKLLLQCDILLLPTTSNNNIYWGQFPLLLTHLSLCILEFLLFNKCGRHSCSVLHADCWCGLYGSKADVAVNGGHTAPNVFWNVSHTKPKLNWFFIEILLEIGDHSLFLKVTFHIFFSNKSSVLPQQDLVK